jgi:hypothetical protein
VKTGRILDQPRDTFCFEYDTLPGKKSMMRLEAVTYERAIKEARSYRGIKEDDRDEAGNVWLIE